MIQAEQIGYNVGRFIIGPIIFILIGLGIVSLIRKRRKNKNVTIRN